MEEEKVRQERDYKLIDGKLVGRITMWAKIPIPEIEGDLGEARTDTVQEFSELGTKEFPKYAMNSKEQVEKQLKDINEKLINLKDVNDKDVLSPTMDGLLAARKASKTRNVLKNLDLFLGKVMQKKQLLQQKEYMETQLKMVNEDIELMKKAGVKFEDGGNRNSD